MDEWVLFGGLATAILPFGVCFLKTQTNFTSKITDVCLDTQKHGTNLLWSETHACELAVWLHWPQSVTMQTRLRHRTGMTLADGCYSMCSSPLGVSVLNTWTLKHRLRLDLALAYCHLHPNVWEFNSSQSYDVHSIGLHWCGTVITHYCLVRAGFVLKCMSDNYSAFFHA